MLETASTVAGLLRGCQINGRFGMQIVETRDRGRLSLGPIRGQYESHVITQDQSEDRGGAH